MSLQVWLPLTKDLRQQGLSDVTVVSGTPLYKNNGKLGEKALDLNSRIAFNCPALAGKQNYSIAFWAKVNTDTSLSTNWVDVIGFTDAKSDGSTGQLRWETCYASGSETRGISSHDNATHATGNFGYMIGTSKNIWYHIACVVDVDNNEIKEYCNGEIVAQPTVNGGHLTGAFWLGETGKINGEIQDVRIYDNALSQQEIKELSKGLVLHYPLNRHGLGQENLALNSYINTSNNGYNTANFNLSEEIVAGATYTATFKGVLGPGKTYFGMWMGGGYTMIGHFVEENGVYTLHFTGPSTISGDGSRTRVNIYAVDYSVDATNSIEWFKLEKGNMATPWSPAPSDNLYYQFGGMYPTSKYDNTIYTESDGSQWTRIAHHNNPAAGVFSSSDTFATGVYKDENRWYDVERLSSKINKWEYMVKQKDTSSSTEVKYRWIQTKSPTQATWYDVYPNSGNITHITTSEYSTSTTGGGIYVSPSSSTRITTANSNNGNWYGGIGTFATYQGGIPGYPNTTCTTGYVDLYIRIDNINNIEYDASGFNNNGTKVGILTYTSDTPKYKVSTIFPENPANYIVTTGLKQQIFTWACWFKVLGAAEKSYQFILSEGRDMGSVGTNICTSKAGTGLYLDSHGIRSSTANISLNQWYHVVLVCDGSQMLFYLNGQLIQSKAYTDDTDYAQSNNAFVVGKMAYAYTNTTVYFPFNGQISDVRIYATPLSADDVKSLYQNEAQLDASGNVLGPIR